MLFAIGRKPSTNIGLDLAVSGGPLLQSHDEPHLTIALPSVRRLIIQGVHTDKLGHVLVDAYQETTAPGVYALGDVCGKAELTPGEEWYSCRRVAQCCCSSVAFTIKTFSIAQLAFPSSLLYQSPFPPDASWLTAFLSPTQRRNKIGTLFRLWFSRTYMVVTSISVHAQRLHETVFVSVAALFPDHARTLFSSASLSLPLSRDSIDISLTHCYRHNILSNRALIALRLRTPTNAPH